MTIPSDEFWMARALELAERGRGWVEPNPLVGAVVVKDKMQAGAGWHRAYGGPHAEVDALRAAGAAARGATLYVTLEPCCHQGKTPACTEAILCSGVRRVVAAMTDPFAQVAGQGFAALRKAGVDVAVGVGEEAARVLNAPYLKLVSRGRPYVTGKWAMSLDGKIATRTGDSRWISSEPARAWAHELRGRMDAILVGIGTALADDPLLTPRPPGARKPCRIVLDSRLRLPLSSELVATAREHAVLVFHSRDDPAASARLVEQGVECRRLGQPGQPVPLDKVLEELGRRRFTNLLVEGGASVLGSFLDQGELDEVCLFLAPRLIGGRQALPAIGGLGATRLADAYYLERCRMEPVGTDWLLRAAIRHPDRGGT
jgi:diaminohydroxyphosphoribosylaminopyrimidine deaminase/5-amino-6-(5-phosphoribosylamino)uracil reductase